MTTIATALLPDMIGAVSRQRWVGLANGDDGAPIDMREFYDRSVQVSGTFGAGGTCVIEGTLNGTDWITLTNAIGDSLSFTAGGIEFITELVWKVRPRVSAGDGSTAIDVNMFLRRSK